MRINGIEYQRNATGVFASDQPIFVPASDPISETVEEGMEDEESLSVEFDRAEESLFDFSEIDEENE